MHGSKQQQVLFLQWVLKDTHLLWHLHQPPLCQRTLTLTHRCRTYICRRRPPCKRRTGGHAGPLRWQERGEVGKGVLFEAPWVAGNLIWSPPGDMEFYLKPHMGKWNSFEAPWVAREFYLKPCWGQRMLFESQRGPKECYLKPHGGHGILFKAQQGPGKFIRSHARSKGILFEALHGPGNVIWSPT